MPTSSPVLPKLVGERVKRREDPRLIQGRATYVDDIALVGMLHMAFKRSDVAHGRIRSIDTSAAAAMEGVEAVFTGAQIAEFLAPYVSAGCRTFNLLACAAHLDTAVEGAAEIRRLLNAI